MAKPKDKKESKNLISKDVKGKGESKDSSAVSDYFGKTANASDDSGKGSNALSSDEAKMLDTPVDGSGIDSPLKEANSGISKVVNPSTSKGSRRKKRSRNRKPSSAFGEDAKAKDTSAKTDKGGVELVPMTNAVKASHIRDGFAAASGTIVRVDGANNTEQYVKNSISAEDLSNEARGDREDSVLYADGAKAIRPQSQIVKDKSNVDPLHEEAFRSNDDILSDEINKGATLKSGDSALRLTGTVNPLPGERTDDTNATAGVTQKMGNPYGSRPTRPDVKLIHKSFSFFPRDKHCKGSALLRHIYLATNKIATSSTKNSKGVKRLLRKLSARDITPTTDTAGRSSTDNINLQLANGTLVFNTFGDDPKWAPVESTRKTVHWTDRSTTTGIGLFNINGDNFGSDGHFADPSSLLGTERDLTVTDNPGFTQNADQNEDYTTSKRAQKYITDLLTLFNTLYTKTSGSSASIGARFKSVVHVAAIMNSIPMAKTFCVLMMKIWERIQRTVKAFRTAGTPNTRAEQAIITSAAVYKNILAKVADLLVAFPSSVPVNTAIIDKAMEMIEPYFEVDGLPQSDPLQTLVVPVLDFFIEMQAPTQDVSSKNDSTIEQPRIDLFDVTAKTNTTPITFAVGNAVGYILTFVQGLMSQNNPKSSLLKLGNFNNGQALNYDKMGILKNVTSAASTSMSVSLLETSFTDMFATIGTVLKRLCLEDMKLNAGFDLLRDLFNDYKGTDWTLDSKYINADLNINRTSGKNYRYGTDVFFEHNPHMVKKERSRPIAELICKDYGDVDVKKDGFIRFFDTAGHRNLNQPTVIDTEPSKTVLKSIPNIKVDIFGPNSPIQSDTIDDILANKHAIIAQLDADSTINYSEDHDWNTIINMLLTDHNIKYIDDVPATGKTWFEDTIIHKYVHNTRYYDEWDIPRFSTPNTANGTPGFTDTPSDGQTPSDYQTTSNVSFYDDVYLLVNRKFNGSTELAASSTMTNWSGYVLTMQRADLPGIGIPTKDSDFNQPAASEATLDPANSMILTDLKAYANRIAMFTGITDSKVFSLQTVGQSGLGVKLVYNNTVLYHIHLVSSSDVDLSERLRNEVSEFTEIFSNWNTHQWKGRTSEGTRI